MSIEMLVASCYILIKTYILIQAKDMEKIERYHIPSEKEVSTIS